MENQNVFKTPDELWPEGLETENFRIESGLWEERSHRGVRYLVNPENDVTELLDGPYAGQQHFSHERAVSREIAKAGRCLPTSEQWEFLRRNSAEWMLRNLPLAGFRMGSPPEYFGQGTFGFYWVAASPIGIVASFASLSFTKTAPVTLNYRDVGYSVRCLKI